MGFPSPSLSNTSRHSSDIPKVAPFLPTSDFHCGLALDTPIRSECFFLNTKSQENNKGSPGLIALVDYLNSCQSAEAALASIRGGEGDIPSPHSEATAIIRRGNILKLQVAFRHGDYDSFVITLNDLVLGRWPAFRLYKTWKCFYHCAN